MQTACVKRVWHVLQRETRMHVVFRALKLNREFYYVSRLFNFQDFYVCSSSSGGDKHKILQRFCAWYSWLPVQGSAAWLAQRNGTGTSTLEQITGLAALPTIGGSEMSSLIGENCYTSYQDLLQRKAGFSNFTGNYYTRWGKCFEPVITQYYERKFHCNIRETGSIPGLRKPDGRVISSYSPDGIAVVQHEHLGEYAQYAQKAATEYIVLFEFKCPQKSLTGKIPDHYVAQPKLGMCTLPFCEMAIFGAANFRICEYRTLNMSSSFCRAAHAYAQPVQPQCAGIIIFHRREPAPVALSAQQIIAKLRTALVNNVKLQRLDMQCTAHIVAAIISVAPMITTTQIVECVQAYDPELCTKDLHSTIYAQRLNAVPEIPDIADAAHNFEQTLEDFDAGRLHAYYPDTVITGDDISAPRYGERYTLNQITRFRKTHGYKIHSIVAWKLVANDTIGMARDDDFLPRYADRVNEAVDNVVLMKSGKSKKTYNIDLDSDEIALAALTGV